MCVRIAVLIVAVLSGIACKVADRREGDSATSQKSAADSRMEELKYSQFCTEAASKFWSRHDWKDQLDIRQMVLYTSHYNKHLNKCLVDVHQISVLNGETSESDYVHDALENTVLGVRVVLRKGGLEGEIENVLLVKDGRRIRDKQEAASFVPWFQGLMTE
jgi:hypothetical protein